MAAVTRTSCEQVQQGAAPVVGDARHHVARRPRRDRGFTGAVGRTPVDRGPTAPAAPARRASLPATVTTGPAGVNHGQAASGSVRRIRGILADPLPAVETLAGSSAAVDAPPRASRARRSGSRNLPRITYGPVGTGGRPAARDISGTSGHRDCDRVAQVSVPALPGPGPMEPRIGRALRVGPCTLLEPELRILDDEGVLDRGTIARAVARERHELISVAMLLRTMPYAGQCCWSPAGLGVLLARSPGPPWDPTAGIVAALAAGGARLRRCRHCGRPGPGVAGPKSRTRPVAAGGRLVAAANPACSARTLSRQVRADARSRHGPGTARHCLRRGAIAAYACGSLRAACSSRVALAALAAWFGMDGSAGGSALLGEAGPGGPARVSARRWRRSRTSVDGRTCSAAMLLWKQADQQLHRAAPSRPLFDHFIANVAFWGALYWCRAPGKYPWAGLPLLAVFALLSVRHGFATRRESFVVYGTGYRGARPVLPRRCPGSTTLVVPPARSRCWWCAIAVAMLLLQPHRRIRGGEP